jgi:glycosyltransferase involved in cell wall biosynthesis
MSSASTRLSVIMANYNHAHYLERALDAILSQSYRPFELVIVDDGSTDNSVKIISRFAEKDLVVKLLRNDCNKGVLYSGFRAFECSTGEYVYSAAADDIIFPGFFEKAMDLLTRHPDAGLCSGLSMLMDDAGRSIGFQPSPVVSGKPIYFTPHDVGKKLMQYGAWFMGNATILRRKALLDVGGYKHDLEAYTDSFACHEIALAFGACFIPAYLGSWRKTSTQYSNLQFSDLNKHTKMVMKMKDSLGSLEDKYNLPKKYKEHWEKRQLYWSGLAHLHIMKQAHEKYLGYLKDCAHGKNTMLSRALSLLFSLLFQSIKTSLVLKSFTFPSHPLMVYSMLYHIRAANKMDTSGQILK